MKKTIFLIAIFMAVSLNAQNPETSRGRNWTVTKLANTDQLVSYPNEITYGPDGWLWITERATHNNDLSQNGRRVVRVHPDTGVKTTMLDLSSEVYGVDGQDGLMGMAIHPDLYTNINTTNNYVYLAYTYFDSSSPYGKDRRLRISRFTYNPNNNRLNLNSKTVLIEGLEASNDHNSGRMKIGPDLKLYYTAGDLGANQFTNLCNLVQSQALPTQAAVNSNDWSTYQGKTLRMNLDGSIPSDNPKFYPFAVPDGSPSNPFTNSPVPDNADTNRPDSEKVQSHIFTYGHRNAQGIVFDSNGTLFQSEHGDRVDDEVNILVAGKNYGWPLIVGDQDDLGYEQCIKGSAAGCSWTGNNNCPSGSVTHKETDFPLPVDFQGPIATYESTVANVPVGGFLTWPTVAPSSIDVYENNGNLPFGKNIFIPTLKKGTIYRYGIDASNNVTTDLIEFHSSNDRYRDMAISPDGNTIYAVTDSGGSTSGPSGTTNVGVTNPGVVFKIEYQSFPEPSNQVTNFTATENGTTIDLNWTDSTGANIADGYAIAMSTTAGNFPTYVDGTQPTEDLDFTDGSGLVLVSTGEEAYSFDDLDENTTYHFQIVAFSNLGTDVDYLTSQAAPEVSETTAISLEPTIIISEIVSNSIPEAYVEIFNYGTLPVDLGAEGFYLLINYGGGAGTDQISLTATLQPGQYYTIGRASGSLNPDLTAWNVINGSGDDAYVLYNGDDEIVDTYGQFGQNGTGQPWDYTNSRAVRKITVSKASNVWIENEWIIESINGFGDVTAGAAENISFIYNNAWSPYDPSGSIYQEESVTVINGTASLTDMTLFQNVTVNSGATLNLGNNGIMITGDLQNNGSITDEGASIELVGSSIQQINGNDFEISNLVVTNQLFSNVNISIKKLLSVQNDIIFDNSKRIILKSDATGTAFVDEVQGLIGAEFITERYIPAKRSFRFVTSALNTATSIYENWQESGASTAGFGTHITGSQTGANGFDQTASGNASIFGFDNVNQTWTVPSNTDNTNLQAGVPYRLFVRGDRTVDLSSNTSTPTETTLRTEGALAAGNVNFNNLSSTAGAFNFIGNPYQAPVDLSQVLASSTNVGTNFVYYWDATINTRGAYVTVDLNNNSTSVTSNFNKFAQPHTAFFVTTAANGPASIAFQEAHKEVNQETLNIFSAGTNDSRIAIKLFEATEFAQGSRERDGALLTFSPNANNAIDSQDAIKFNNLDENIAIARVNTNLSIERRSSINDGDVIELFTNNYRATQYELKIDMDGVLVPAYLYDGYLNTYTQLHASGATVYSYDVDDSVPASIALDRFRIEFSNVTLSNQDQLNDNDIVIYPNPTQNNIINIAGLQNDVEIQLFNMVGQEILIPATSIQSSGASMRVELPLSIVKGTYLLTLSSGSSKTTQKIFVE